MRPNPIVHLELHTDNLPRACAFYTRLLGWQAETVHLEDSSTYLALGLGGGLDGGVVEHASARPVWLPYAEVDCVEEATERALGLGACLVLEPREGPAGWRSIVAAPAGAEIALFQRKEPR